MESTTKIEVEKAWELLDTTNWCLTPCDVRSIRDLSDISVLDKVLRTVEEVDAE